MPDGSVRVAGAAAKENASLPKIQNGKTGGVNEIPIAARFKGPGPAAYTVPSTFATRYVANKAPAWTFGVRLQSKDNNVKMPGPGSFYPTVTREGNKGGPTFSIQGRFRTVRHDGKAVINGANETETPGPAAYNIKDTVANPLTSVPAYTMLGRTAPPKQDSNPGPAQYNVGTTVGTRVPTGHSAPSASILGHRSYKVSSFSPGPALYNNPEGSKRILKSAPAYSLGARIGGDRRSAEEVASKVPGPANYTPSVRYKMRAPPSFSFGVRHSEYEAFVPGNSFEVCHW